MPVLLLAVRVLMLMDLKGSTLGDAYIISKTTTSSLLEESFRKHSHQHNPKTLFEQTTHTMRLLASAALLSSLLALASAIAVEGGREYLSAPMAGIFELPY
jgi:ABC-type Fe3+ transport system permease subunit